MQFSTFASPIPKNGECCLTKRTILSTVIFTLANKKKNKNVECTHSFIIIVY